MSPEQRRHLYEMARRNNQVAMPGSWVCELLMSLDAAERQAAEAEKRGAEKGWEACKDWFALLGPLNDHPRVSMGVILDAEEANPYRGTE